MATVELVQLSNESPIQQVTWTWAHEITPSSFKRHPPFIWLVPPPSAPRLGNQSLVYVTGHIKDPVPLIEKRRGLSPGGRFPPSFIHQVSLSSFFVLLFRSSSFDLLLLLLLLFFRSSSFDLLLLLLLLLLFAFLLLRLLFSFLSFSFFLFFFPFLNWSLFFFTPKSTELMSVLKLFLFITCPKLMNK